MRKTFGMCAVAALLFPVAGVVASASGTDSSDHRGHLQVPHLRTVDVAERFIDLGDPDFSQGDQNVFTADLYKGDRRVTVQGFVNVSAECELQPFEPGITGETGLDLVFRVFR